MRMKMSDKAHWRAQGSQFYRRCWGCFAGIRQFLTRTLSASQMAAVPQNLLGFNARKGYVIGLDILGSYVGLPLADLDGTVVGRWNAALRTDRSPEVMTDMVGTAVRQLLREQDIPVSRISQMCAGAPGIPHIQQNESCQLQT
jgi:hypothetical protein